MLVEIAKVPNAGNSAIHLHPTDNVAIARVPLPAGTELRVDGLPVLTRDAIPAGHKLALWDIAAGETVERYGQAIGRAKVAIDAGHPRKIFCALPGTGASFVIGCFVKNWSVAVLHSAGQSTQPACFCAVPSAPRPRPRRPRVPSQPPGRWPCRKPGMNSASANRLRSRRHPRHSIFCYTPKRAAWQSKARKRPAW